MKTINQAAFEAAGGIKALNLIMKRTRQDDIVLMRGKVFKRLRDDKFSYPQIARFFNMNHSTVWHGINRLRELKEVKERLRIIKL